MHFIIVENEKRHVFLSVCYSEYVITGGGRYNIWDIMRRKKSTSVN